jgi:hypothetical protein
MKIKFFILLIVLFSTSAVAGEPANDRCSAYSGKAFGICISAMNNACGTDNEENAQACDNMENHFIDVTGEMPPWLVCPCWAEAELQAVTADNFIPWFELSCNLSDEFPNFWALIAAVPGSEWGHNFGFAVLSNPNHPSGPMYFCQVVDYPDYTQTDVAPAEADICISQVVKRCADIGHPYPSE